MIVAIIVLLTISGIVTFIAAAGKNAEQTSAGQVFGGATLAVFTIMMMLAVIGLFLAMTGAGRYSLDNALDISLDEWVGTVIGLGGALGGAALLGVSWRPAKG